MQIDLQRIDRVDPLTHTFRASVFLALVIRDGALDENLMKAEAIFPLDMEGKLKGLPSAMWFWQKIEIHNAVSVEFKDVQPVRRGRLRCTAFVRPLKSKLSAKARLARVLTSCRSAARPTTSSCDSALPESL